MIGLSTYAYFWRMSERVPSPMSLDDVLRDVAARGVRLFQICDHLPLETATDAELHDLRALADSLGVALELGTRGTEPAHIRRHLHIAGILGATLLRSMWTSGDDRPDAAESESRLRDVLPDLEAAGVTLALETYEQVSSAELVALVEAVDSPLVGICLDPANTVANLELPADVTARCLPHVVNWHVKDFDFSRNPGWVGFFYAGTALGDGRLDYEGMRASIRPHERGINQIVEFWLPWQTDAVSDDSADALPTDALPTGTTPDAVERAQAQTTIRLEAEWTDTTLQYLRSRNDD